MSEDTKQRWIPLESNPKVLNKYIHFLGVTNVWKFNDVYGIEVELLQMVPRPVLAVMLLYPLTDKSQEPIGKVVQGSDLYFIKQTIGNACGTIAIVHALANNRDQIDFSEEGRFKKFLIDSLTLTPEERASHLEKDEGMSLAHELSAQEGQTQAPDRDEQVNTHFITFICHNDGLYELDGRKAGPVYHGKSSSETLLEDAVMVVKEFMKRDPDELNFSLLALATAKE